MLQLWAEAPAESLSLRAIVRTAAASPSAVQYHFGNLEHLYLAASQTALASARLWTEARLTHTASLAWADMCLALQASVITTTIADWTTEQRRLALAQRHAPSPGWHAVWDGFWHRLAAQLGLAPHGARLALFAAGEAARHLLVWNPPLDRALLEETVTALLLWLEHRTLGAETVRLAHRAAASAAYRPPQAEAKRLTGAIADAAGALLAEGGHAAVTFRAVADRAGVTLGTVIHHCGTKSALLEAALHRLYEREALRGDRAQFVAQTFPPAVMLEVLLGKVLAGQQPVLRAYDEIERAIANGADFAPLRGVVRSMEDPSGSWSLQQLLGGQTPPASLVAAFSAMIRGIGWQVEHADLPADALRRSAHDALAAFLEG